MPLYQQPTTTLGPGLVGRGGNVRPPTPDTSNAWGNYYQNFANNQGFTGNAGNTVAQAGQPAAAAAPSGTPGGLPATGAAPPAAPLANRGGSSTAAGAVASAGGLATGGTPTTAGNYPPINPGEDSMAYMLRIGMSPADAQRALAISQQNPGMTFQQIMAQMGGGSTGNNVNPTSQGVSLGQVATGGVNGVPGYGGTFNLSDWQDPGYDFRLQQGNQLLQGSAAAQGNLLSGPTLKAITDYGQNSASQEYQNAFNRFTGNRAFNYGVDVGDRNFNYLTQTDDRNFNYGVAKDLAQQGQYGTTGTADVNKLIATLLSGNILSGGNANAANTIGGGNAISTAISQAISQYLQQNMFSRLPGVAPQG